MTAHNNEDLPTLQCDVERMLGRCLLRLQQYEGLIKALVAHHAFSGRVDEFERDQTRQLERTARKTLGTLVGELLGSYVVREGTDPAEKTSAHDDDNWVRMQSGISLPAASFERFEKDIGDLVNLRNILVHHFIEQHDLNTREGCLEATNALNAAYEQTSTCLRQLQEFAEDTAKARKMLSEFLQTQEFRDWLVKKTAPDKRGNLRASNKGDLLRAAFLALAVDGWASMEEMQAWMACRFPEHSPASFGCRSWRQVVHEAKGFEIRYFENDGQRSAFFRETRESQSETSTANRSV